MTRSGQSIDPGPQLPAAGMQRLPWPFVAAALVSFCSLYLSGRNFPALIVLSSLLILASVTAVRLPANKIVGWTLRITVWVVLIITGPRRHSSGLYILFEPSYIHLFGCLCAAEIVLRAWTRWPPPAPGQGGGAGPSRGETLLLIALIMTAASATYDRLHMHLLVPVWTILMILCLRSLGRPGSATSARSRLPALRIVAGALALAIGAGVVFAVTRYDYILTAWAADLLRQNKPHASEIGLGGAPRLRAVFNPAPSPARILLIEGSSSAHHLRAIAFDTYQGRQWHPTIEERVFLPIDPTILQASQPGQRLRFTRLSGTLELLPLPLESAAIEPDGPIERDALGTLRQPEAAPQTRYAAVVPSNEQLQGPLCLPMDDEQRRRALAVPPEIDPAVAALARQVAGDVDPAARVVRLDQHLRSTHAYSLAYDPGSAEPLSDFILNRRSAHCQYFASAMVLLARAAGVPARFVTGYYAHEQRGDNALVVRQRDAHAWAECWIDGVGWISVDPTPAGGRPDTVFPRISWLQRWWERAQDAVEAARSWLAARAGRLGIALGLLAAAAIAAWLIFMMAHRRRVPRAKDLEYAAPTQELALAARQFERWLRRRGVSCAANRTWREHLDALARGGDPLPVDVAACRRFIDAYDEARFGGMDGQVSVRLRELMGRKDG